MFETAKAGPAEINPGPVIREESQSEKQKLSQKLEQYSNVPQAQDASGRFATTMRTLNHAIKSGDMAERQNALLELARMEADLKNPLRADASKVLDAYCQKTEGGLHSLRMRQVEIARSIAKYGDSAFASVTERSVNAIGAFPDNPSARTGAMLDLTILNYMRKATANDKFDEVFKRVQSVELSQEMSACVKNNDRRQLNDVLDVLFALGKNNPYAAEVLARLGITNQQQLEELKRKIKDPSCPLDQSIDLPRFSKNLQADSKDLFKSLTGYMYSITLEKKTTSNQSSTDASNNVALAPPRLVGAPIDPNRQQADKALAEAKPEAGLDNLPRLIGPESDRARFVQGTLMQDLARCTPKLREETNSDFLARLKITFDQIKAERDSGVFGPATRRAWLHYQEWMRKAIPAELGNLEVAQLSPPTGFPIPLALDQYGRAQDSALQSKISKELKLDLNLGDALPTQKDLNRITQMRNWLSQSYVKRAEAEYRFLDEQAEKFFRDHGWNTALLHDQTIPREVRRQNAAELINLCEKVAKYYDVMTDLNGRARNGDFPVLLPPGAELRRDKHGKVTGIDFKLPKDLRLDHPAHIEILRPYYAWIDKYTPLFNKTLLSVADAVKNPDAVLQWGDQEVHDGIMGRFDKNNNFIGLYDPNSPNRPALNDGEYVKNIELLRHRMEIRQENGKILVDSVVEACTVPWYGYQNLIADRVGNKFVERTKEYSLNDFVPILSGGRLELIRACDLLTYKRIQQARHYGDIGLNAAIDLSCLTGGGTGLKAISIARKKAVTIAAEQLTKREARIEAGKQIVKGTVGLAGIANNAGARDTDLGVIINNARGLYFMADAGIGLGGLAYRQVRSAKAAGEISVTQKLDNAAKDMNWVFRTTYTGSKWGFKALEAPMAYQIGKSNYDKIDEIARLGERNGLSDAFLRLGNGFEDDPAKLTGAYDVNNPKVLSASQALLGSYSDTLPSDTKPQIRTILDQTQALLAPGADPEARKRFKEELLKELTFDKETIGKLAQYNGGRPFTVEDLRDLRDECKLGELDTTTNRSRFTKEQQQIARAALAKIDPDVQTARAIALLFLSRDANGNLPDELGTTTVYCLNRPILQTVTPSDLVRMLRHDLASPELGRRGIVIGDVLMRLGALSGVEYAQLAVDVLTSPTISPKDKMLLLTEPSFVKTIDTLRERERQEKEVSASRPTEGNASLTSETLLAHLEKVARTDQDPDVRDMAAMISYGAQETDPDLHKAILYTVSEKWRELGKQPGGFAQWANGLLSNEVSRPIPPVVPNDKASAERADGIRRVKFNAVIHLSLLTKPADRAAQERIARTLAETCSPTNRELTMRSVYALLPDRMKLLSPSELTSVKSACISSCRSAGPGEPAFKNKDVNEVVDMIELTQALLETEGSLEDKRNFSLVLRASIDPSSDNPRFAESYPEIRKASIEALARYGTDPDTSKLILGRVTSAPTLTIGTTTYTAGEQDPAVRKAAIHALKHLGDPLLPKILFQLLDKEQDNAVSTELRNVRYETCRIARDSRAWKDIYEDTSKNLIPPASMPKGFDSESAAKMLETDPRFSLLGDENFQKALKYANEHANSVWGEHALFILGGSTKSGIQNRRIDACREIVKKREEQWQELCNLAKKGDEEGNRAKAVLNFIMVGKGRPLSTSFNNTKVEGVELAIAVNTEPYWQRRAAAALADCCAPGTGGRDLALHYVRMALTSDQGIYPAARLELLRGWREFGKEDFALIVRPDLLKGRAPTDEEFRALKARVTAEALQLETKRLEDQSPEFQVALISDLHKYRDRSICPVLDAIKDRGVNEDLKRFADRALGDLQDSVILPWNDTVPAQLLSPQQRADALQAAISENASEDEVVQRMYSAYKGYTIPNAHDPGMKWLRQVIEHDPSPKVILAACLILRHGNLNDPSLQPDIALAIRSLIRITRTTNISRYKEEGSGLIDALMSGKDRVELRGQNLEGDKYQLCTVAGKPPGPYSISECAVFRKDLRDGKFVEYRLDAQGKPIQFTTPELGTWTSANGETFVNAAGNKRMLLNWKTENDGSFSFEDQQYRYVIKPDGTMEKSPKQLDSPGGRVLLNSGHATEIRYATRASRFMKWDSDDLTRMEFVSADGSRKVIYGRLMVGGKWTDKYTVYSFTRNPKTGDMVQAPAVQVQGGLNVSPDGTFTWKGTDGSWQRQTLDGPFESSDSPLGQPI